MEQTFEKWYPDCDLDTMYDVYDLWFGVDGCSLLLLPDGRRRRKLAGQQLVFTWDSIAGYQLTQAIRRKGLRACNAPQAWSFWQSTDSGYLKAFREENALPPEGAVHWAFVGTHLTADVIAVQPPKLTVVRPNQKGGARGRDV